MNVEEELQDLKDTIEIVFSVWIRHLYDRLRNIEELLVREGIKPDDILPLKEVKKRHALLALERRAGNKTGAARDLQISVKTLRELLRNEKGPNEH